MKKNKKGFTIVELVIVIAVIAVLAAVLIPTFSNLINRANVSNDTVLVANINKVLAAEEQVEGKGNVDNAIALAAENGYSVEKLTPRSNGNLIVWDETSNRFVLVSAADLKPVNEAALTDKKENVWILTDQYNADKKEYSQYLKGEVAADTTLDVAAGLSVGKNTDVNVNYAAANEADVSFVMNGGTLTVDNENATVHSFGEKEKVVLTAVAEHSYYEYGKVVGNIEIEKGRLVIEATAEAASVVITADAAEGVKVEVNGEEKVTVGATIAEVVEKLSDVVTGDNVEKLSYVVSIVENLAGGFGTEANPYILVDLADFNNIKGGEENVYYQLAKDIVVDSFSAGVTNVINPQTTIDVGNEKFAVLDLNKKTICIAESYYEFEGAGVPSFIDIVSGTLTVKNGTIDGNSWSSVYCITLNGGNVIVESGKYLAGPTTIHIYDGVAEIKGGEFSLTPIIKDAAPKQITYLINCNDSDYKAGRANFVITGGIFYGLDPSCCPSETGNPNFVAEGYKCVKTKDQYDNLIYTVTAE